MQQSSTLPAPVDLEAAVLAVVLDHPERFDIAADLIDAGDFYDTRLAAIWHVVASLQRDGRPDVPAVLEAYRLTGGDPTDVAELLAGPAASIAMLERHCEAISRASAARRLVKDLATASNDLLAGADPTVIADRVADIADRARHPRGGVPDDCLPASVVVAKSMNQPRPWVLPGLVRATGRCIIVGREGGGKSTMLRQIAVAAAAGIHPFTLQRISPVRVLVIDFENDHEATAVRDDDTIEPTSFAGLIATARRTSPRWDSDDTLLIWTRPSGIDIRSTADRAHLEAICADFRPDLVIGGPVYKLHRRRARESDEELAADLQTVLDRVRIRWNFALVLEHHAPKGDGTTRTLDPFGSSLWLRWPDIGIRLAQPHDEPLSFQVGRFRGDRYTTRWPTQLHRGGPSNAWPWVGRYGTGMP